jgi:hypothetical protein
VEHSTFSKGGCAKAQRISPFLELIPGLCNIDAEIQEDNTATLYDLILNVYNIKIRGKNNNRPLYTVFDDRIGDFLYSEVKADKLAHMFQKLVTGQEITCSNQEEREVVRLYKKCDACKKTLGYDFYNDAFRSIREGPSFAKELKKKLQYGYLNEFESIHPENKAYDKSVTYKLKNYDDLFPFDHCFPWKEDDPEDIRNSAIDLYQSENLLIEFEEVLDEILKDSPDIELTDVDKRLIGAKGGTSASESKERYRGFAKLVTDGNYSQVMEARRSVIQVGPANVRDSVTLTAESANSVAMVSKYVQQVIYKLPESAMRRSAQDEILTLRKSERLLHKLGYCYTRDYKKSGLTMPKSLIRICKRCFEKRYPTQDFSCFNVLIYQKIRLNTDIVGVGKKNEYINLERGHGLGMANELTTLIQVVVIGCV